MEEALPDICPKCGSCQEEIQPVSGTHVCTTEFVCGYAFISTISGDHWEEYRPCQRINKGEINN